MNRLIRVVSWGCVLVLAATVVAQEEKPAKKPEKQVDKQAQPEKQAARQEQKRPAQRQAIVPAAVKGVSDALAKLDLTAEQSEKIKQLTAKVSEQIAAINKERTAIVGPELAKKMNEARKDAQAAGKKGRQLQEAVYTAAGLSNEQIDKLRDLQTKQQQIIQEFRKAVSEILTPEQREKARLNIQGRAKARAKTG